MAACDVVLSLHRSEGFGLVPAEAMLLGKPVVATDWSGTTEFLDADCAALVPAKMVPARDPRGVFEAPGAVWAEPDGDAAAAWLRAPRRRRRAARRHRRGRAPRRARAAGRGARWPRRFGRSAWPHEGAGLAVGTARGGAAFRGGAVRAFDAVPGTEALLSLSKSRRIARGTAIGRECDAADRGPIPTCGLPAPDRDDAGASCPDWSAGCGASASTSRSARCRRRWISRWAAALRLGGGAVRRGRARRRCAPRRPVPAADPAAALAVAAARAACSRSAPMWRTGCGSSG